MVRGYPKALSRRTDPHTSKAAAGSFDGKDLETISGQVLAAIADRGKMGATAEEVSDAIRRSKQTVTPRIRPLVEEAKVRDSGRTRKNRSGRAAIVWEWVAPDEREALQAEQAAAEEMAGMTVAKLRKLLGRMPAEARVQVVVDDGLWDHRHQVLEPFTVQRGDQFARDRKLGPPNGEGAYAYLSLDESEVILEATEVGEWDDDDRERSADV